MLLAAAAASEHEERVWRQQQLLPLPRREAHGEVKLEEGKKVEGKEERSGEDASGAERMRARWRAPTSEGSGALARSSHGDGMDARRASC